MIIKRFKWIRLSTPTCETLLLSSDTCLLSSIHSFVKAWHILRFLKIFWYVTRWNGAWQWSHVSQKCCLCSFLVCVTPILYFDRLLCLTPWLTCMVTSTKASWRLSWVEILTTATVSGSTTELWVTFRPSYCLPMSFNASSNSWHIQIKCVRITCLK